MFALDQKKTGGFLVWIIRLVIDGIDTRNNCFSLANSATYANKAEGCFFFMVLCII